MSNWIKKVLENIFPHLWLPEVKINSFEKLAYEYIHQWTDIFCLIERKTTFYRDKLTLSTTVVESIKVIHELNLTFCNYLSATKRDNPANKVECDKLIHYITLMDGLLCKKTFSETSFNYPFIDVDKKIFQSMNTVTANIGKDFKDTKALTILESNIARYFFFLILVYAFDQDKQRFLSFKYDKNSFNTITHNQLEKVEPLTYYFKEILTISGETNLNIDHISFGYSIYELGTMDFKRLFDLTFSTIK